jgi:hypothetical protein
VACKPAIKKVSQEKAAAFAASFRALRAILAPYARKKMRVVHDTTQLYYIETSFPTFRGKPAMFGAVRKGKAYVSFHLMPLYMNPALASGISADLKKRKQGKTCFNFENPDRRLFAKLAGLTKRSFEYFRKVGSKLQEDSYLN